MSKVKIKVSGCFRTERGAHAWCRITSYLDSMGALGYNPLVAIKIALAGNAADLIKHHDRAAQRGEQLRFDYGPFVEVEGKKYTKAAPTTGRAMTTLGPVEFKRPRYRATNRQGESFIPAEHQLGLTEGNLTPAAAGLSMALISSLTARESADYWKRFVGDGPSTGTLVRLSGAAGRCLEECSTEVMDELRKQEELPENASMVQVGLDGVMMRMNAEKNGDEVIEKKVGERRHVVPLPFATTTETGY